MAETTKTKTVETPDQKAAREHKARLAEQHRLATEGPGKPPEGYFRVVKMIRGTNGERIMAITDIPDLASGYAKYGGSEKTLKEVYQAKAARYPNGTNVKEVITP